MPSLLYYLRRASEQSFRETLTLARHLASGRVRSAIQPTCDRLFQKPFTTHDLLRLSGFSSSAALGRHVKTREWPALKLTENSGPVVAETARAWHADPRSGFVWDAGLHYRKIPLAPVSGVDIKAPWELSRCHHLVAVGMAYRQTQDERYARQFVSEVKDWIAQNPVRYGVNWVSAMEAGIRAVNWSWALSLMRASAAVDEHFIAELLSSLREHAQFIRANLEYREAWVQGEKRRLNSNHYLCDLAGLLTIGLLFPELRLTEEVLFAQRELETEILQQTTDDGVDYEHSTAYHRFVHEIFAYSFELLRECGRNVEGKALIALACMESFSSACLHPDGVMVQIGDNDSGRLLREFDISSILTHRSEAFPRRASTA